MPSIEIIIRLARFLQVPSSYLFQLLDDEDPFQEFIDSELYLALPENLSQTDKTEIKEFVQFKRCKKESASS
jgi:transcriptional regulator with XRE-family HTH domain